MERGELNINLNQSPIFGDRISSKLMFLVKDPPAGV